MNRDLVPFEDLKEYFDLGEDAKPSQVERYLLSNGIIFHRGKSGHPITTVEAINRPLRKIAAAKDGMGGSDDDVVNVLD